VTDSPKFNPIVVNPITSKKTYQREYEKYEGESEEKKTHWREIKRNEDKSKQDYKREKALEAAASGKRDVPSLGRAQQAPRGQDPRRVAEEQKKAEQLGWIQKTSTQPPHLIYYYNPNTKKSVYEKDW
jgi:hypothetical protein